MDTDDHLAELLLGADPEALADLRVRALAPLASVRPTVRVRLEETLRSWLLHHGRRELIAGHLFVHPQTVRYRMGQLRELFGDRLDDPEEILRLTLALALPPAKSGPVPGAATGPTE
ncbi:MAG: helix-turn-helix domain-containing protein [Actinomycetales bacterium]|nr:helix-turn-helix domain-containing protein [Candidatus Phosphoribacter baldrii]MBK6956832.1 helix-turn-helix domain-containing protein [Candidatus Phosphoribacter baldrii]